MISVCIITKNEKDKLEKCLKALSEYPFEVVVVDTGSDDGTVKMAKKYTNHIFYYKWIDDFAAARNYAASMASNDRILVVDSDETACSIDYEGLLKLSCEKGIGRSLVVNDYTRNGEHYREEWRLKRYYDRRFYEYTGRIHEQIVSKDRNQYEVYDLPVEFMHSGYDGDAEQLERKADRNIELLLREYNDNPDDAYILYQLGKSYYMKNDYENAYKYFDKATYLELDENLEWVEDLIVSYGYAMLNTGRSNQAMLLENLSTEFGNTAEYRFVMGLIYMNNMMYDKAYAMFMSATDVKECRTEGVNSYKAIYNAGVIRECLGNTEEAVCLYRQCGQYDKALQRLKALQE